VPPPPPLGQVFTSTRCHSFLDLGPASQRNPQPTFSMLRGFPFHFFVHTFSKANCNRVPGLPLVKQRVHAKRGNPFFRGLFRVLPPTFAHNWNARQLSSCSFLMCRRRSASSFPSDLPFAQLELLLLSQNGTPIFFFRAFSLSPPLNG